jgi:hypothetical protein
MRNIIYELTFIHDIVQKGGRVAAFGGILVLALGLVFGRLGMVLAGAFVILVVAADYFVMLFFKNRNSN